MPEPNLPPLRLHLDRNVENKNNLVDVPFLKDQLPELPEQTRAKLKEKYDISKDHINKLTVIIFSNRYQGGDRTGK